MSRVVIFICLLMLASAVVSLDLPGGLSQPKLPNSDLPKTDLPKTPDLPDTKGLPNLGRK